jgi:hypothetical protein
VRQDFIKYIVIIITILGITYLSQQAYAASGVKFVLAKVSGWVGEVKGQQQVSENKSSENKNIGTKIQNYFSNTAKSVFH